jgi:hypothetical protein
MVSAWVAVPVFPAPSVTDAVTVWLPSASVSALTPHAWLELTVEVSDWPLTVTCTFVPACSVVVPRIHGEVSLVERVVPPSMVTTGSITSTVRTWLAVPVWPLAVTDAVTVWEPSTRLAAVTLQTPAAAVVVSVWPLTVTETVGVPGSPVVPEMIGEVSVVPWVAPPSMLTTGVVTTLPICRLWVMVPVFWAASVIEASTV